MKQPKPLKASWRWLQRQASDLRGALDMDRWSNDVVRRTDFRDCPRPVLLLYGFFSTRRAFQLLETRLRRDGYCVWSVNLGGMFDRFNTRSIDESAEKVREKVDRLYARYDLGPLSIVGHSKGGIIGHYYVKRLGGDRRVRTLVTLAAPHHGAPIAYLGCAALGTVAPSCWQLTPMSPFLRRLNIGAFPRHVRLTSIYSKDDGVVPYPSPVLELRGFDNLNNIEVPGVTHRHFLTHRGVYEALRKELAAGYGELAPPEPAVRPLSLVAAAAARAAQRTPSAG